MISYTFAIGIASAAIYSVFVPIQKDTGLALNDLNEGTGYMVWRPCSQTDPTLIRPVPAIWMGLFVLAASRSAIWEAPRISDIDTCNDGKPDTKYIDSTLNADAVLKAILVWMPYTKTNGQWIGSKILQGFFGAPVESLCEISLTDLVRYTPELCFTVVVGSHSIPKF